MRLSLLLLLATAACVQARPFHWPWSKGTAEHQDAQFLLRAVIPCARLLFGPVERNCNVSQHWVGVG